MILDKKVTYFNTTTDIDVAGTYTIGEVISFVKEGKYKDQVQKIRKGDTGIKTSLPTVAAHGLFEFSRKKSNFYEASGLVIIDIDDVPVNDIEESKRVIFTESDHVFSVMTSPSGNGIKVLYYVTSGLITADNYRQIGKQLAPNFEIYGNVDYLSITDCLIMTYDPKILVNTEATPDYIYIKEPDKKKVELEKLDKSKTLWDDPEDFFQTVLFKNIQEKTNNNFHFIQVSVLDLAKFGFRHPEEDLSFVIDYTESIFKASKENKRRFLEMAEVAKNYPQTRHPYNLSTPRKTEKANSVKDKKGTDNIEDKNVVNYNNLFKRVIEVMKEGPRVGREVSFSNFSDAFRFKGNGILTITGIPSHGKTEFTDALCIDLARFYNESFIFVGFEQSPEEHIIKLTRKLIGADVTCPTWLNNEGNQTMFKKAYNFIQNHFSHIDTLKVGGDLNQILETTESLVCRLRKQNKNPRYLVLDPFNMLSIKGSYNGHEKIEEMLRKLVHFSHSVDVMIILVAHPYKMHKNEKTGLYVVPDFYSVKGSSAFFEMSYHGLVVYRTLDRVLVRVLKVKQNNMGSIGADVFFEYERCSGRYIPIDEEGNELKGDQRKKNWLD